jgi:hypothetical protein
MRHFIGYWIAVLKLTKAQAFALFYRFVRYVSWSYKTEWGDAPDDDAIILNEEESKRFIEALENPPEPCEALKEAARKYRGDDVV